MNIRYGFKYILCIAIININCITVEIVNAAKNLNLLGMMSETGESYRSAGACLTAMRMAIDDINSYDRILKDYDLVYKWIDSKVCTISTFLIELCLTLTLLNKLSSA